MRERSYSRSPMNAALIGHYRCPDIFADFALAGRLSDDMGYFRFGQNTVCYGQSTSGVLASRADAILYDGLNDVTTDGSSVLLPFNSTAVVDNLRLERYA